MKNGIYQISLVSMPFATLRLPSIALTQLKSVVEERFGDRVRVRIHYLSHDMAREFGPDFYHEISVAPETLVSGFGDWLFRQVAFPDLADNTEYYLRRYFPREDAERRALRERVFGQRERFPEMLETLIDACSLADADLVGCTSMFAQNTASIALCRALKARDPKIVTVLGGANCETTMGRELARHVDCLDFVFSGPALLNFPELIGLRMAGDDAACHELAGVYSQRNVTSGNQLRIGAELPIDTPVPLDYDSFLDNLADYFPNGEVVPTLNFETSRGCWWGERSHCTFCGLNGSTMRYRSMQPAPARELFLDLFKRYGERCTLFDSVDNIMPREYLTELFPKLETPPGISLFYEVKADLKDHEMQVLARAGVRRIQPGIEALSSSTLKLMGKGTTAAQNLTFLKNSLIYDIEPDWNLLIGFPRERAEVYEKYAADIPSLMHLPPPSGAFPVRFDRYSPYFNRAAEFGLDLEPFDFYGLIYPFGKESLSELAYYFEDQNRDADYIQDMIRWRSRLASAVERWNLRYWGRDGMARAALYTVRDGEAWKVIDSRSGQQVEHPLSEFELQVLRGLGPRGSKPETVARRMGEEGHKAVQTLARLRRLGLVFKEGELLVSLLIDDESWVLRHAAENAEIAAQSTIDEETTRKLRHEAVVSHQITTALEDCSGVLDGLGSFVDSPQRQRCPVAWLVSEASRAEVLAELRGKLPAECLPTVLTFLDELPRDEDGKIQQHLLPEPLFPRPDLVTAWRGPQDELEAELAQAWREILVLEKVGVDDNFFDLGGDSLLLTRLHTRLRRELPEDLPIMRLFEYPTVSLLADFLRRGAQEDLAGDFLPSHDLQRRREQRRRDLEEIDFDDL